MTFESLEERRLFAVTVAEGYPGFYEVQGDNGANVIDIAVSQEAETFTLDGTTYSGVQYITVYGGGGADTITLVSSGWGYIAAGVNGGDGADTISLNIDGAIWGGAGGDTLRLFDSFRGEVYGEEGDDFIFVGGDTVDATIEGGAGNDRIDATLGHYGLYIRGGSGDDVIYGTAFDDALYGDAGNDVIYAGAGNDSLFNGEYVDGGTGTDILYGGVYSAIGIEYVA